MRTIIIHTPPFAQLSTLSEVETVNRKKLIQGISALHKIAYHDK